MEKRDEHKKTVEALFQNTTFLKKKLKCIEESKKAKDRRLNIRLANYLIEELEKISKKENTSLTYLIEDALCTYIALKSTLSTPSEK